MVEIKNGKLGGNANNRAFRFHEDGSLIGKDLPDTDKTEYGDVCNLGNSLSGVVIRAYADEAINATGTATLTLKVLAGDTKTAAATDTAAWREIASVAKTGTALYAEGEEIMAYVPEPNEGAKYYLASVTTSATGFTGKVSVRTELVP